MPVAKVLLKKKVRKSITLLPKYKINCKTRVLCKRQAKKFGIGTYHTGQRIDGEIVYCSTKVVPCWNCNELILLDTSDERLGQYCSDQCRDELYRREQSVSRRRKRAEIRGSRCCDHCSQAYEPKRLGSRFCSTRCRVAANRASKSLGGEQ